MWLSCILRNFSSCMWNIIERQKNYQKHSPTHAGLLYQTNKYANISFYDLLDNDDWPVRVFEIHGIQGGFETRELIVGFLEQSTDTLNHPRLAGIQLHGKSFQNVYRETVEVRPDIVQYDLAVVWIHQEALNQSGFWEGQRKFRVVSGRGTHRLEKLTEGCGDFDLKTSCFGKENENIPQSSLTGDIYC